MAIIRINSELDRPIKNGVMIIAALVGAFCGYMFCPHQSDCPTNDYNEAKFMFLFSIVGLCSYLAFKMGVTMRKSAFKMQYGLMALMEFVLVCAIIASLGANYLRQKRRLERLDGDRASPQEIQTGARSSESRCAPEHEKGASVIRWANGIEIGTKEKGEGRRKSVCAGGPGSLNLGGSAIRGESELPGR
jgi:hypothetical protein